MFLQEVLNEHRHKLKVSTDLNENDYNRCDVTVTIFSRQKCDQKLIKAILMHGRVDQRLKPSIQSAHVEGRYCFIALLQHVSWKEDFRRWMESLCLCLITQKDRRSIKACMISFYACSHNASTGLVLLSYKYFDFLRTMLPLCKEFEIKNSY